MQNIAYCFPVNIAKFLRTLILMKICEQLLMQFLLLTVNISSWVLVSALNSIGLFQRSSSRFKEFSLGCLVVASSLIWKKKEKLAEMVTRCYSLPLVVTLCHSLSFFVTRCTTRCHSLYTRCYSLYHSLSFVVTRCHCHLLYHSLSLDVPLTCLFLNDLIVTWKKSKNFLCWYDSSNLINNCYNNLIK